MKERGGLRSDQDRPGLSSAIVVVIGDFVAGLELF